MSRSASQIEFHYRVEKELAARLRSAPRAQRLRLYGEVYDELFRRVPEHPQLHRKHSLEEQRAAIDDRLALLRRFIDRDTVFLEIGAGDACLTREVARIARRSYALDVSHEILDAIDDPRVTAVWSDGCSVPVPDDSVTLAYSYQVMEHIHPDDALEQLRNLHRALAPGGVYVCVTPNRTNGPHDVSRFFDDEAHGFHLREYTLRELARLFREVGFGRLAPYVGIRRRFVRLPLWTLLAVEGVFLLLTPRLRRRWGRKRGIHKVLMITLKAEKPALSPTPARTPGARLPVS
jgi:SAM-dependent methyltransferase